MSEYDALECTLCGYYYMRHQGACPNCYPDTPSNATNGEYLGIAYPNKLDKAIKAIETIIPKDKKISPLEQNFLSAWANTAYPMPIAEYRFHPTRKWRFDFCWPEIKLVVETEGGVYGNGRHNRPMGYIGDLEKYNAAAELGYTVLRYHKIDEDAINQVKRVYDKLKRE